PLAGFLSLLASPVISTALIKASLVKQLRHGVAQAPPRLPSRWLLNAKVTNRHTDGLLAGDPVCRIADRQRTNARLRRVKEGVGDGRRDADDGRFTGANRCQIRPVHQDGL